MYSWKRVSFALCLVSVPLRVSADPPDHAANKNAAPDVLMARHAEAPGESASDAKPQPPAADASGAAMGRLELRGREGAEGSGAPRPPMAAAAATASGRLFDAQEGAAMEGADSPRARGQRSEMLEGLRAGQGNLNAATQRLEQAATLRERAEQARSRAWTRWKSKLLTEDAIDPKIQRELEKHARREAKLRRLGALAQQAGDTQALERLAKLQALEAALHDKHMQALTAKSDRSDREPAQP
ncbi:MAG TPA: hypothetical protein VMF89_15545 [Polyangiales bacterium]|nr:hypothetical protein [Polyangiales bacterium]